MREESIEIPSADGLSFFRIEKDNLIRLILKPEDKPIIIGKLSANCKSLQMFKPKSDFRDYSYNLSVAEELLNNIPGLQTVGMIYHDTKRILCALVTDILQRGVYTSEEEFQIKRERQRYISLQFRYWTEVSEIEDIEHFYEDRHSGNF